MPASGPGGATAPGLGAHRSAFSEFGQSRDHKPNPMAGRTGLEGNSAAYDMKSLDKHLEAVSLCRETVIGRGRESRELT